MVYQCFKNGIFPLGYHKINFDNDPKNPLTSKTPTTPPVILDPSPNRLTQGEASKILPSK